MTYNLSTCVFIRNNFDGAFCLFESMATLLPITDEFIVMDLGSTDGTLAILQDVAAHNPKVKLLQGDWPEIDAAAFATLANDLVALCKHGRVLYYQADEIWHEDLLALTEQALEAGSSDLSFWRVQYKRNFQDIGWYPHPVHRIGLRDNFHFNGDGMNTNRVFDAQLCSTYGGEFFTRWGQMDAATLNGYTHEMIMDVSQIGGFRDNIIGRRKLHAPMWHESEDRISSTEPGTSTADKISASEWQRLAEANPDWTRAESPFNLPAIMRWHVGRTRYELRLDLLEAIKRDRTREYIEGLKGGWR